MRRAAASRDWFQIAQLQKSIERSPPDSRTVVSGFQIGLDVGFGMTLALFPP
jgi:hypothetical protein